MNINIPEELIKELKAKFKDNVMIQELRGWHNDSVETRFLSVKEFDFLFALSEKHSKGNSTCRKLFTRMKYIKAAKKAKTKRIKRLEPLTEALITEVTPLPNHVVYKADDNNTLLPYYIDKINFEPYNARTHSPANITVILRYFMRGDNTPKSLHVESSNLPKQGVTVDELITDVLGLIFENAELNTEHLAHIETYKEYHKTTGSQYLGSGELKLFERHWYTSDMLRGKEGRKLVMENDRETGKHGPVITNDFWVIGDDEEQITLPIHPIMRLFDLSTHEFVIAHVSQLMPYEYDTAISDKLVLDPSKKNMIDMLVTAEDEEGGDIIKGKSGGIIILSSGEPGTGKTLTAEVYSETTEKALYVVQCSQLGTDPDELEKKLQVVMDRATRWGVVLLIDEADVYIHERGSNLQQNAIVGVFLRLLEYYGGILFLTTNRETIVDDAIISRITAHVRYAIPEKAQQREIWKIMADQYKLKLSTADIKALLIEFPKLSGRTIKQLVRLVKVMSMKDKKASVVDLFKEAAIYQPLTTRQDV